MYKLKDWVDETKLENSLSCNERAVEYLENHEHLIDDCYILENVNAIHIIEKIIPYAIDTYWNVNFNKNAVNFLRNNPKYIDYTTICNFEHGIEFVDELIKKNELDKIKWVMLSINPAAMHILNNPKYYKYIVWENFILNENSIEFVKNNVDLLDEYWYYICKAAHLIDIVEQHMDKINWNGLSFNCNAIHILEKNIDKINADNLCLNKNGFGLLLRLNHNFEDSHYHPNIVFDYFDYCDKNNISFNIIKILSRKGYTEKHMEFLKHTNNYEWLSMNPNIFEYDYTRMRETRQSLLWYNDIKK